MSSSPSIIVSALVAVALSVGMLFLNWVVVPILNRSIGLGPEASTGLLVDFVLCFIVATAIMYLAQKRQHPHGVAIASFMAFVGWFIYFWEVGFIVGMLSSEYALWYEALSFAKYPAALALSIYVKRWT